MGSEPQEVVINANPKAIRICLCTGMPPSPGGLVVVALTDRQEGDAGPARRPTRNRLCPRTPRPGLPVP